MLSYGYSILYRNLIGAIARHSLHPYFAFMHKVGRGHAALASDLVEDRIVLDFVNSGEVMAEDFETNKYGAVNMGRGNMRRLTTLFTRAMEKGDDYFFFAHGDGRSYGFRVMPDKNMAWWSRQSGERTHPHTLPSFGRVEYWPDVSDGDSLSGTGVRGVSRRA